MYRSESAKQFLFRPLFLSPVQRRGAGRCEEGGDHLEACHQGGRHAGVRGDGQELHDPGSVLEGTTYSTPSEQSRTLVSLLLLIVVVVYLQNNSGPCQELGERAAQPGCRRRRAGDRRRGDRAARQGERGRTLKEARTPDIACRTKMMNQVNMHLRIIYVSSMSYI